MKVTWDRLVDSPEQTVKPSWFSGQRHYTLHELFTLCEYLGCEPWYVLPGTLYPEEIDVFMEYVGAPPDVGYGKFRAAQGHADDFVVVCASRQEAKAALASRHGERFRHELLDVHHAGHCVTTYRLSDIMRFLNLLHTEVFSCRSQVSARVGACRSFLQRFRPPCSQSNQQTVRNSPLVRRRQSSRRFCVAPWQATTLIAKPKEFMTT